MLETAWESRWLPDFFQQVAGDRSVWGQTGAAVAGNSRKMYLENSIQDR